MIRKTSLVMTLAAAATFGTIAGLSAYPGGTPTAVTNAAPYCATCHSSLSTESLRDMPAEGAQRMLVEKRHFPEILGGEEGYERIKAEDRPKLVEQVKTVDANSHITLTSSANSVKPGAALTVTVNTHGGGGPVIGVMLTDNDIRMEAGPVQSEGFIITQAPDVTGPDGKPQTKFTDGRFKDLPKGINYVNIYNIKTDITANSYSDCKVVYSLKAPQAPGEYSISAAFLYGTEKGTPLGAFAMPGGRVMPVGGGGAHAGRIVFAKPVMVKVS